MADQIRTLFRYQNFHINKSQPLGHGSYGAVYKAKCDQLPCAAKVLHPTILDPSDPGADKILQRFQQECAFLENIRHPNIVQYLGMTKDPESRLPVLLMELLDENLTKMLERSLQPLAYCVQVDICHDIALAVTYLHSNDIIHRDLSSNNVLIMAKSRAKVTDFGMSKLDGAAPSMTPLTMCPGTLAYMPPEAFDEPLVYTKKLDCFSEGVIMIQVCTQLWPEPGPRTKTVPFPASPTSVTLMPVPEPERRKNHINMIDRNHSLLPIAIDCLHYQERERPSSEELCQRLADLKETREYRESKEKVEMMQNDIAQLERQMKEMLVREQATVQQLHKVHYENQKQHQRHQSEVQSEDILLKQQDQQIQSQERQIQKLNQQLEEQEQVTTEIQRAYCSLLRQMEQVQKQLSQQIQRNTKPPQPLFEAQGQLQQNHSVRERQSQPLQVSQHPNPPLKRKLFGEWRDGGRAPYCTTRGAAVADGNVVYFMDWSGKICSYDLSMQWWSELPKFPHQYSSLAVLKGLLTAIGGSKGGAPTSKLLSIIDQKWVEHFPSMPTKRSHTVAVTTKQHLIVAGGRS